MYKGSIGIHKRFMGIYTKPPKFRISGRSTPNKGLLSRVFHESSELGVPSYNARRLCNLLQQDLRCGVNIHIDIDIHSDTAIDLDIGR